MILWIIAKRIPLILFTFLLVSCTRIERFDFQETDLKYFEFVHENPSCEIYCDIEYIVVSNGMTLTKTKDFVGREIIIGKIDPVDAEKLVRQTETQLGDLSNGGIDCRDCNINHIFYGDKSKTQAFTTYVDEAPEFIQNIHTDTERVLQSQQIPDQFFMNLVFKKNNEFAKDYHFFPDGTVLIEEFGELNGNLISSEIVKIDKSDMDTIRLSIEDGFFTSEDDSDTCWKKKLDYGYIQVLDKDKHNFVFICGIGDSSADRLFNKLVSKVGG
ncbi:MAG: hypothetical protein KKG59_02510 [Nanoarchaeota archaeon]|nr:hypothetical protein [Nanoarchaeota archaeon]MBU1975255.1 hypothetical protein [Nanoarchaeota archaeon]